MNFIGRTLGFIFLLFKPTIAPRRDYLINCLICSVSLSIIPLMPFIPKYAQLALVISNLISGFSKAYIIVPYMIVIQYFDPSVQNKKSINFWCSLTGMGGVLSVFCTSYMMNNLSMSWKLSFYVNIGTFLIFTFINHFLT